MPRPRKAPPGPPPRVIVPAAGEYFLATTTERMGIPTETIAYMLVMGIVREVALTPNAQHCLEMLRRLASYPPKKKRGAKPTHVQDPAGVRQRHMAHEIVRLQQQGGVSLGAAVAVVAEAYSVSDKTARAAVRMHGAEARDPGNQKFYLLTLRQCGKL